MNGSSPQRGDEILQFIITHFDSYPLESTNDVNFYLFKAAGDIMNKKAYLRRL